MKDSNERERTGGLDMRSGAAVSEQTPEKAQAVVLTKPQMAAALQVSVSCLTDMMNRNEIAYFKIGRLVRFRVEEALKRMEERCGRGQ